MKRLVGGMLVVGFALVSALGVTGIHASNGQGEGHTPVGVCHWVPAHGGSYVFIVVDDDGANGNKNLRAHAHHEFDIIPAYSADDCPGGGVED